MAEWPPLNRSERRVSEKARSPSPPNCLPSPNGFYISHGEKRRIICREDLYQFPPGEAKECLPLVKVDFITIDKENL